jgi:hypothetical protein
VASDPQNGNELAEEHAAILVSASSRLAERTWIRRRAVWSLLSVNTRVANRANADRGVM